MLLAFTHQERLRLEFCSSECGKKVLRETGIATSCTFTALAAQISGLVFDNNGGANA
jgi:hypothetical protein